MGGKKGGGARTPTIEKNTLHGANRSKHVDLISSGEIFGFEYGNDEPLKSIYLNDTPIQNQDGTLNFSGVRVEYNRGSEDQDYLPSFTSIDRNIDVGAQVKKNVPVTRSVSNTQVTSVRVTVGVDALMRTTKEGDQLATSVSMTIMLMKDNQIYTSKIMTLNEKGSKPFRQDFEFNDLPAAPFEIRCVRNTEDSNDDMLRNNTYFFNYVESIDAKMSYPLSSVVGIEIDAEQFGNNSTTRTYGVKGVIVQVPSNYDPVARTYSGLWDRLFKPAYTNNPAWVFHDLLTNEVDGFGSKFQGFNVDIDTLYQLSKYCDELVDDGKGGKEPRFVCNAVIMGDDAYKVLYDICSIFRGVPSYNGQLITTYYDRKSDITAIYTNSNVIDGLFEYGQIERDKQYNQIQVQYVDQENGYETTIVEVSDDAHIAQNGLNTLSTVAFGQTKESYALRSGSWTLVTSLTETETVSFGVGDQGIKHEVYDIIQIADNDYIGTTLGARIKSASSTKITLDRELNNALKFSIETINGPQNFKVKRQISANEYELDKAPLAVEMAQCTAILEEVEPRLFRCLSIEENDDKTYTITAIQHNSQKEAIVDKGAQYVPENTTVINPLPSLSNGIADNDGRAIILRWDSLTVIGTNNTYRIQLFRDKAIYQTFETNETFLKLENLPQGEYIAKIRAINEKGQHSEELTIAFSTTYKIDGLRAKGVAFGVQLNWQLPALITSDAFTEIWRSEEDDRMTASKFAVVTYPQSQYPVDGLSVGDAFYFWFRLVDRSGNQGEFSYSIKGEPLDVTEDLLGILDGKIGDKQLSKDLKDQFDKNIDDKVEKAKEEINSAIDDIEIDLTGVTSEIDNIKTGIISIDSEIDGIKTDVINIDSNLEVTKKDALKALSDAEKNAQAIKDQSTVIDEVKISQDQSEASWQLAQMSNVSAHKSEFARSMSMSAQVAQNIAKIEEIDSFIVTEKEATATRFTQINTRVDGAESKITSVEQSLSSDIKAEASKREALEAVFDLSKAQQQLQLMTQATADKSLSSRLFSMSASTANAHAKYDELKEVVATNEDARVTSEQKLQAEIDSSKANITRLDEVMTSEFTSQATSISNLSASLDDAKADIKTAEKTIADNENAQAKIDQQLASKIDGNSASQQLQLITQSSNDASLSHRYFSLSAQTANSSAKIESLEKVFVDSEVAWSITEQRLQSQLDSSKSEISRIDKTVTDNEKAQSTAMSNLSSEIGNTKSSISNIESTVAEDKKNQAITNQNLSSEIDGAKSDIQEVKQTQATDKQSLTQQINTASSEWKSSIEIKDTRDTNENPSWYFTHYPKRTVVEMKRAEIMGLGDTPTYCDVTTVVKWTNSSAGDITQEANWDNKIYTRAGGRASSGDKWGAWEEQETTRGSQAKADAARKSAIATSEASIKSLSKTQADDKEALTKQINSVNSEWKSANSIKYLTGTATNKTPIEYADLYGTTTVTEFGMGGHFGLTVNFFHTVTTKISYLSGLENGRVTQTAVTNSKDGSVIVSERKSTADVSWSSWVQVEDVKGAQAKADAAQKEAIKVSKASIDSLATTQANDKEAITKQMTSMQSEIDGNKSSIKTLDQTVTNDRNASAESFRQINSKIGEYESSITEIKNTQTDLDGKVSAMWTMKVDANGVIGGIMLGSDGHESMLKFAADNFIISTGDQSRNLFTIQNINGKQVAALNVNDFIVNGSVSGDKFKANTSIQAPIIIGGRIESGHFAGGSLNIGNGACTIQSNGDFYAKNGRFEGTVYASKIEGDVVKAMSFSPFTGGADGFRSFNYTVGKAEYDRVISLTIPEFTSLRTAGTGSIKYFIIISGVLVYETEYLGGGDPVEIGTIIARIPAFDDGVITFSGTDGSRYRHMGGITATLYKGTPGQHRWNMRI